MADEQHFDHPQSLSFVGILYHMEPPIATNDSPLCPPAGKSYAAKVDDEKTAFEQGRKHRQNGHKNPATSIVAAFADMGG